MYVCNQHKFNNGLLAIWPAMPSKQRTVHCMHESGKAKINEVKQKHFMVVDGG